MKKNNQTYCIGDSHVSFFSGLNRIIDLWPFEVNNNIRGFKCYRLGPVLAYNLSVYGSTTKGRELLMILLNRGVPDEKKLIPSGSRIILCFGEIDCRAHIQKIAEKKNLAIEDVIEHTVRSYIKVIKEIHDLGYELYVWNAIPNNGDSENKDFPSVGTKKERINICLIFNKLLAKYCSELNVEFLTILDKLINNGVPDSYYYMDSIHLSPKAFPLFKEKYAEKFDLTNNKKERIFNIIKKKIKYVF